MYLVIACILGFSGGFAAGYFLGWWGLLVVGVSIMGIVSSRVTKTKL